MVSRVERTPFARLVVDGRPADAGGAARRSCSPASCCRSRRARRSRRGSGSIRSISSTGTCCSCFPPIAVLVATSFLPPRQIRRLALVVFAVSLALVVGDAGVRRRGQGRAALDRPPRRQHPAVGIRQAGLRDPDRLAVRRNPRAGRKCRPTPWRWRCCSLVVALLVLQPDFGQTMLIAAGLGRAVLHGRHAADLGRRASAAPPPSGLPAPISRFRTWRGASSASSIPSSGDTFQIDQAIGSFVRGGWFGRGPGRGHGQAHPARQPCRLRLRGRGRGVRHRALPGAASPVRLHRAARAASMRCATRIRSRASPPPGSRSCSACNPPSTWRSTCISCRPRA